MQKRLTITVDEQRTYNRLHSVVGRRRISRFIETLVRPYVDRKSLDKAYRQMAKDTEHESQTLEWAEATISVPLS